MCHEVRMLAAGCTAELRQGNGYWCVQLFHGLAMVSQWKYTGDDAQVRAREQYAAVQPPPAKPVQVSLF